MNNTDPIADMLTRIRNAVAVRHESVLVPGSKEKIAQAGIMKSEGFISNYEILRNGPRSAIRIRLKYSVGSSPAINGLKRVSKPGLRTYVGKKKIPRPYGGMGISIVSTSQGVMTGSAAWRLGIGGELICYLW